MVVEPVSLDDQIRCLKREIAMRQNVYPKWVTSGRMKQDAADREIAAMTAALHTVMAVQAGPVVPRPNPALIPVGDEFPEPGMPGAER